MLNSTKYEIYVAYKCKNANNWWHFNTNCRINKTSRSFSTKRTYLQHCIWKLKLSWVKHKTSLLSPRWLSKTPSAYVTYSTRAYNVRVLKVRKRGKIRNRYNQAPHKASINGRARKHSKNKTEIIYRYQKDQQMKHRLGTVSTCKKIFYWRA